MLLFSQLIQTFLPLACYYHYNAKTIVTDAAVINLPQFLFSWSARFLQEKGTRSIDLLKTPLFSLELLLALYALGFNIWESIWADCWISHRHLNRVLVWKELLFGVTHHFIGAFLFESWECYSKETFVVFQRSAGLLLEIVLFFVGWMLSGLQVKNMNTPRELYLECLDDNLRKTPIPRIR